ncbi:MAG: MFS transporter [Gammaproteobacteria bacterium]|nr:MFS transporter [Gammaproteobacteria bacterium]
MTAANNRPSRGRHTRKSTYFRWYQMSVASFLVPHGMLEVLFPFLIAVYLAESPERVGQAQTALMLPPLVLLLIAGVIADRVDQRRMLITLYLINVIPVSGLLIAVWFGQLNYTIMLIFAVASGSATAFVRPVLDAMLNRISGPDIQRTVTATIGVMYGMNLAGYFIASSTDQLGITPLLTIYLVIMVSGAWFSTRLPAAPPAGDLAKSALISEIREGIQIVLRSKRMLPPVLLTCFGGLFLGGPYAVLLPLILRDIYGGGARDIAFAYIAFVVGGATSTTWLFRRGGAEWPGRALIAGYVFSGIALFVWSTHVPYWGFFLVTAFWGFGGGMCHIMSRTIMQESAPATHRARVLSVYYLGGLGTAPIGALATGYLAAATGSLQAALLVAIATAAFCLFVTLFTNIWNERASI